MKRLNDHLIIPQERIERIIFLIRGQKVILDRDLADLYDVMTKALNQAVKRNERRFPPDRIAVACAATTSIAMSKPLASFWTY